MSDLLRINLGSGQRKFGPGWVNIDVQAKWSPDICCSGDSIPLPSSCAQLVVMHHVLEHFGCGEADACIQEVKRLLAPGGSLIVTVPNIPVLVAGHQMGAIDDFTLMVNLYGAYMGDEADRHKWGYTQQSLREYLRQFGWSTVVAFDHRPIPGADIANDWWILGMEAFK